jgi:adenosylcobinamide-phosphate synthase
MILLSVLVGVLLDIIWGEPKRYHPLVGFGNLANGLEKRLNLVSFSSTSKQFLGMMSWLVLVILPSILCVLFAAYVEQYIGYVWLVEGVFLYLAIGYRSLRQHSVAVLQALTENDIEKAREKVGWIVSRETKNLDAVGVRRSTIESVLENGSDAVFAPLFWFLVGGVPAVVIYRLANTLDAMWGYKNEHFLFFGRFSARMDDVLNYLPSRLVALSYAVLGRYSLAMRCWHQQAKALASPNGGVVMTAGAGTLNLRLGGDTHYHGQLMQKPFFGGDNDPEDNDITRSIVLIDKTLGLWCGAIVVYGLWQWVM